MLWETGDDIILRAPGQAPGTTMKAALDIEVSVRDYLNESGKLLVSGKNALLAQSANGGYLYNPNAPGQPECTAPDNPVCLPVLNDFLQYWLGAYTYIDGGGTQARWRHLSARAGSPTRSPVGRPASTTSQDHTASFVPTSGFLPPDQFPWFGPSSVPVDWVRPSSAPFEPHSGDWHAYSGQADESYKRLTRTVDLTDATTGRLQFFTSYETEVDWDYLFVEAHKVGSDDWTTLPDLNGHTGTDTGLSCPEGWGELHPFLAHYQTKQGDECTPTGTTGHLARSDRDPRTVLRSGRSTWLRTPASRVELSITYVSDWGTRAIGRVPRRRDGHGGSELPSPRRRSRRTSAAGRWRALRRAPQRTPPTGRAPNSRTRRERSR